MLTLALLLRLGGVVQLAMLSAAALVPKVLDWRAALGKLDGFLRRLVWVYGFFIVFVILGFGTLSLVQADALAAQTPLARAVCALICNTASIGTASFHYATAYPPCYGFSKVRKPAERCQESPWQATRR